jgi:hypothetical protein
MTDYQAEAQFFLMPDGSKSSVQMKVGADGQPVPVAVKSAQQLADWDAIQAAKPPSPSEFDAHQMAFLARPLVSADAAHDASAPGWLDTEWAKADAEAGVVETPAPKTPAEWQQRADAAATLAASLGLQLVLVRDDPVMGVPEHLELRQPGNPFGAQAGDLTSLEVSLRNLARERAKRDEQIRQWREHTERQQRETAERIAATPAARLARLEAALAAQGISIDA